MIPPKNEMKLRRNQIISPKNFSFPTWRIPNSSRGNSEFLSGGFSTPAPANYLACYFTAEVGDVGDGVEVGGGEREEA